VHIHKEKRLEVWGSNFTVSEEKAELLVQGFEAETGKCTWEKRVDITLLRNQSTELLDELLPEGAEKTIFTARILMDGKVAARYADWPQPIRHLDLPKPNILLTTKGDEIHVSSSLPVKGLSLDIDDDKVYFDDNVIDVMPGDDQVIHARGLNGRNVTYMHLGMAVD